MRKILLLFAAAIFIMGACSKNEHPVMPVDTVAKNIIGKWALSDIPGLEVTMMSSGLHANLYSDTLIYTADMHFIIIDHQDSADRGDFTVGHGEAINGFGRMQSYDSILYHSSSLVLDAGYRPSVYFKLDQDTLRISTAYFKDSAEFRLYANYVRQ